MLWPNRSAGFHRCCVLLSSGQGVKDPGAWLQCIIGSILSLPDKGTSDGPAV